MASERKRSWEWHMYRLARFMYVHTQRIKIRTLATAHSRIFLCIRNCDLNLGPNKLPAREREKTKIGMFVHSLPLLLLLLQELRQARKERSCCFVFRNLGCFCFDRPFTRGHSLFLSLTYFLTFSLGNPFQDISFKSEIVGHVYQTTYSGYVHRYVGTLQVSYWLTALPGGNAAASWLIRPCLARPRLRLN